VAKLKGSLDEGVDEVTSGTFIGMTHMGTRTIRNDAGHDGNG